MNVRPHMKHETHEIVNRQLKSLHDDIKRSLGTVSYHKPPHETVTFNVFMCQFHVAVSRPCVTVSSDGFMSTCYGFT